MSLGEKCCTPIQTPTSQNRECTSPVRGRLLAECKQSRPDLGCSTQLISITESRSRGCFCSQEALTLLLLQPIQVVFLFFFFMLLKHPGAVLGKGFAEKTSEFSVFCSSGIKNKKTEHNKNQPSIHLLHNCKNEGLFIAFTQNLGTQQRKAEKSSCKHKGTRGCKPRR